MPSPEPSKLETATLTDGLPPAVIEMQRRSEALFMALKAAERRAAAVDGARPRLFRRPDRPGRAIRALMRLVPPVARRWQIRAIRQCGLFDAAWYLGRYPDVQAAGADPAEHFLRFGMAEGRDPGPGFATAHYLRLYPDVKAAGLNPLVHYLTAGWEERRSIHPQMPEGQG